MPLLNYLRENRYEMAIATSSSKEKTYGYLGKAGLTKYFHVVITGDMVSQGKPDPEIYLTAFKELNKRFKSLQKSQCIVIEDAPSGIQAAKKSGMNVVMVPDLIEPTLEIQELLYAKCGSLLDVKRMLEKRKDVNETSLIRK